MSDEKKKSYHPDFEPEETAAYHPDFEPETSSTDSSPISAQPSQYQDKPMEAGLLGAQQFLTAGHVPQIQGKIGAKLGNPTEELDRKLRAQGFTINQPESDYLSERDAAIERASGLQKENPGAYIGGQLTGAGLLAAATGGLGRATSVGGRLGVAAGMGGLTSFLENPGDKPGEVAGLQFKDRLSAVPGGVTKSLLFQGAGETLGKGLKALGNIGESAKGRAAAAVGLNKSFAKKLVKTDPSGLEGHSVKDIGDFVLKNKLVQAGDDIETIAKRVGANKKSIGEEISKQYDAAETALSDPSSFLKLNKAQQQKILETNFDTHSIAQEFLTSMENKFKGRSGGRQAQKMVQSEVENFLDNPKRMGIKQMQDFKESLDDMIFAHDKTPGNLPANSAALKEFRDFLKSKMDARLEAIDSIYGSTIGTNLKELNKQYSKLSTINKIARDRLSGEIGNNLLSLTDKMAGIAGAAGGGVEGYRHGGVPGALQGAAIGAGMGLASKGARTYGRPIIATSLDTASKISKSVPGLLPLSRGVGGLLQDNPLPVGAVAPNITLPGLLGNLPGLKNREKIK